MPKTQQDLTESLSIALGRDVAEMSEEDLLDLLMKKLLYYSEQILYRNGDEAELTKSIAAEIVEFLKLRIIGLREVQPEKLTEQMSTV